jgi:hypothetical protein
MANVEVVAEEDDGLACDCGCWKLGRGWFIAACVFEGAGVIVLAILLYNMYQMLKGS